MIKDAFFPIVCITWFMTNNMTVCVVCTFQADGDQRSLPTCHGYYQGTEKSITVCCLCFRLLMSKEAFLLFIGITWFIKNKLTVCVVCVFQVHDDQRSLSALRWYYFVHQKQDDSLCGGYISGWWWSKKPSHSSWVLPGLSRTTWRFVWCVFFRLVVIKDTFLPFMGITWVTENSMVAAVSYCSLFACFLSF